VIRSTLIAGGKGKTSKDNEVNKKNVRESNQLAGDLQKE
jgi:hypothetical protein